MKNLRKALAFLIALTSMVGSIGIVNAQEKIPLKQAIKEVSIFPVEYKNKALIYGELRNIDAGYQLYKKGEELFIPVSMLPVLINSSTVNWQLYSNPSKPNTLTLVRTPFVELEGGGSVTTGKKDREVTLTLGDKSAVINGEKVSLDKAPYKTNGRVVVSLKDAATILDIKVSTMQGLVVMGSPALDMASEETLELLKDMKKKLMDKRVPAENGKTLIAAAKYKDTTYYAYNKINPNTGVNSTCLYMKKGTSSPKRITIPEDAVLSQETLVDNKWYYKAEVKGQSMLCALDLTSSKIEEVANLTKQIAWDKNESHLVSVKKMEGKLYMVMHYFDYTMGNETLYLIEKGKVTEVAKAKQFLSIRVQDNILYYSEMNSMINEGSLFKLDLINKEKSQLGQDSFIYDIAIEKTEGAVAMSGIQNIYIKEGVLYTLGYKDQEEQVSELGVYAINIQSNEARKLTLPAKNFWITDQGLFYLDQDTNYLVRTELDGSNKKTVLQTPIKHIVFQNGNIYYTIKESTKNMNEGLYKYNLSSQTKACISNDLIKDLIVNNGGVYYTQGGVQDGLYKVTESGCKKVAEEIKEYCVTEDNIVYIPLYEDNIYIVK